MCGPTTRRMTLKFSYGFLIAAFTAEALRITQPQPLATVGLSTIVTFELSPAEATLADGIVCVTLSELQHCAVLEDIMDPSGFESREVLLERLLPGGPFELVVTLFRQSEVVETSASVLFHVQSDDGSSVAILNAEVGATGNAWQAAATSEAGAQLSTTELRSAYFDEVYKHQFWSAKGTLGADSGPGSNSETTARIRPALASLCARRAIRSVLDIPCGDMNWVTTVPWKSSVEYAGADVSPVVVERNRKRFAGDPRYRFFVADVVEGDTLFKIKFDGAPPDLIFVRHLSLHLPPEDNLAMLRRVQSLGAKWVMLSTRIRADANLKPFVAAKGHPFNAFRAPYCIRDPEELYLDDSDDSFMGLWWVGPGAVPLLGSDAPGCMGP